MEGRREIKGRREGWERGKTEREGPRGLRGRNEERR